MKYRYIHTVYEDHYLKTKSNQRSWTDRPCTLPYAVRPRTPPVRTGRVILGTIGVCPIILRLAQLLLAAENEPYIFDDWMPGCSDWADNPKCTVSFMFSNNGLHFQIYV